MSDPFDLQRFVDAQDPVYARVTDQLRSGRKTSHWMWFVFPQIAGLGMSSMSHRYAIGGLGEAKAYLHHPVLGARLRECTELVLGHTHASAAAIFGGIDAQKFQSCMTLFTLAAGQSAPFDAALDAFYGGVRDEATLKRLKD